VTSGTNPPSSEQPPRSATLENQRSYAGVVRKSVIWGYLRVALQTLIAVPTTVILARLLTPEEFGIAAVAMFFGQLSNKVASGGMGQALIRMKDLREDHISTVFTINAAVTAVVVLLLVAAGPALGRFYETPEIGWLLPAVGVTFALGAMAGVQQALLSRDLRYRETATISSIDITVTAVSSVIFAALGFRYWSLVLSDMCGALAKVIYGITVVGWHTKLKFVPSAARELGSFAAGSYVRRLLSYVAGNVDSLIVGKVLGMTALGFYDKAYGIVGKISQRLTVVGPGVSFRVFSIIQEERERFRQAYRKVIMMTTLITYSMFAVVGATAPHLIVVVLGEQWRPSVVPCQILCVAFGFKVLNQYAITASSAHGWVWQDVTRQIIGITLLVAGIYLAAGPWGINGVAVAVLAVAVINFVMTQGITRAATGLRWADTLAPMSPAATLAVLLVASLWAIDARLAATEGPVVTLLTQAVAAMLIGLAFAKWCPFAQARVLMHDALNDVAPALAARLWSDIAEMQAAEKRSRRAARRRSTAHASTDPAA
jgi:O-antigen/teichoic acid export membrane protein